MNELGDWPRAGLSVLMGFALLLCWGGAVADGSPISKLEVEGVPNLSRMGENMYFSGQPEAAGLAELAGRGVGTVINLRSPEEMASLEFDEARSVDALGMHYIHVPNEGEIPGREDLHKLYSVLSGAHEEPLLLHCASSNRAGMVWALYRAQVDGVPVEQAIADGRDAGMRSKELEATVRAYLTNGKDQVNP